MLSLRVCLENKGDGVLQLKDAPIPTPEAHEALIQIKRAGICSTVSLNPKNRAWLSPA
jgi:D-arabinose 1-dehydrogenase-like Zn-dependent alcohol dehydrogenase